MNDQLPFEGDTFILAEIIKLRDRLGLTSCVASIEADPDYFIQATHNVGCLGVQLFEGPSQSILPLLINDDTLYYLDAHGCGVGGCPLKEELTAIIEQQPKNIAIAIHDFQVPGKDFGFDTYDYPLTMNEIEPLLKRIFKNPAWHYNTEANGAYRGIVYIYEGL